MFLSVTIWANEFKIIQIIVIPVPVSVMNLQYFVPIITTSFTTFSSFSQ